MLVMARVIEHEQGDVDRALDMNRQILALDEGNEQALDALERLYLGKGQFEDLLGVYEKKLELTPSGDADGRIAIQTKIGQLYEDEVKDDTKAIAAYLAILDAAGDEPSALRALDRVYQRNAMWKELADILEPPAHDRRARRRQARARRAQVPARPAQASSTSATCRARSTPTATSSTSMPAHDRAGALSVLEQRPAAPAARRRDKHQLTVAGILEPVYEQLGEWAPLVGVHEIQLAAEKDPLRRTSLLLRIGELQRTKLLDAEKRVRRLRPRVPRGSRRPRPPRISSRRSPRCSRTAGPAWSGCSRAR